MSWISDWWLAINPAKVVSSSVSVGSERLVFSIWLASTDSCCSLKLACAIWVLIWSICSCSLRILVSDCFSMSAACCCCTLTSCSRCSVINNLSASCCLESLSKWTCSWLDWLSCASLSAAKLTLSSSSAFNRLQLLSKVAISVSRSFSSS